jgi:cytochrome P450
MTAQDLDVDLTRPEFHTDRAKTAAFWEHLRRTEPVARHGAADGGFWVVSGYDLVVSVYRDAAGYTSANGNVLATLLHGGDSAGGRMLAVSDGPRHREIRRELSRSFSPEALASVTRRVTTATRRLIADAVERGRCDFARDVAAHIPIAAVCDLFGIAESDRAALFKHTSAALSSDVPDATDLQARMARNEILLYFRRLAKREPQADSLLALLVQMMRPPLAMTEQEVLFNCYSLLMGGDETTRLAMTGSVKALMDRPDQWQRLVRGEVSLDRAVEELLRWTTPAMHSGRVATRPAELAGHPIAGGDVVTVWMISANFDEQRFGRPMDLDLGRTPNPHLTFAFGPHACLGARLARIELRALLEALIAHVRQIEQAGPALPVYSNFLSGFSSLPITFRTGGEG